MKFTVSFATLICLAASISALSIQPRTDTQKCSSLLCTCDFAAESSDCARNFCNSLRSSTSSDQLSCSNDFLNTAAADCCSSADPATCLASFQQTSSMCNGGKGSIEELRRRVQGHRGRVASLRSSGDDNQKRQYSYDSYSTGASYDEDESGCTWNFDGASPAGACDTPSTYDSYGSTYDSSGSDYGYGDSTLLSGAKRNNKIPVAMLAITGIMATILL